jgi:C1A family cysteine protease
VLETTLHKRVVPIFDQGNIGSCTGNACAGALGTQPNTIGNHFDEEVALRLYCEATRLDWHWGHYPPTDTGSSGLAVAKAAKEAGYVRRYNHAFGLDQALRALVLAPVITGVSWYEGFDHPDSDGLVRISGSVRGGHEFCVVGLDVEKKTVRAANSWGTGWGDEGFFEFSWDDWGRLLDERGDVTQLVATA